jgi:hypothetical protein
VAFADTLWPVEGAQFALRAALATERVSLSFALINVSLHLSAENNSRKCPWAHRGLNVAGKEPFEIQSCTRDNFKQRKAHSGDQLDVKHNHQERERERERFA